MSEQNRGSRIAGTGSCVPERILTNNDLEEIVDTNDEWITRRTGIKERRVAMGGNGESTTALASKAARRALEMAGLSGRDLDMIAVGTVTPDRQFPSAACMIQRELEATGCAAFDLSAGCSGFLYALGMVNDAIRCGSCTNALVVGVERLSTILNWQDRGTCVLLGDGAGAVVLTAANGNKGILSTHLQADGQFGDLLYSYYGEDVPPSLLEGIDTKPFKLAMEGNRLFKRAINCLADIARQALEHNGLTAEDIDLVIPHQANIRIIQGAATNLGIPMDKVYTNVDKYGNTSSASIPIALDEANRKGLIQEGDRVLLITFGAGLTWGASVLEWHLRGHA